MNTIFASTKKRFENYAKRLFDKRNIDHLELFSKHVIPKMEDKIISIEVPLMARYIIILPRATRSHQKL
jgi:hypothetical protein